MEEDKINIKELGTTYEIPIWKIETNIGLVQTEETLEINFVRGDKRHSVTEAEYKEAMDDLRVLVCYPGVYSKHISGNIKYAVDLSDDAIKEKNDKCKELDSIIDRYKNPIRRINGIRHEQLMEMMIIDLEYKNSLFPSNETQNTINKLKEALFWQEVRSKSRSRRGVQGKYEK